MFTGFYYHFHRYNIIMQYAHYKMPFGPYIVVKCNVSTCFITQISCRLQMPEGAEVPSHKHAEILLFLFYNVVWLQLASELVARSTVPVSWRYLTCTMNQSHLTCTSNESEISHLYQ